MSNFSVIWIARELIKLGADIQVSGSTALVHGKEGRYTLSLSFIVMIYDVFYPY